jgi:DNA-binding NtrC family response regulator
VTLEEMMQRLERQLIEGTLRRCRYNKERPARGLGLARSALFKRLKKWGLSQGEE